MRKKQNAFTLLELLIAISISSFVALAMIQMIQNVQRVMTRSRKTLVVNRSICLMFNQIERDLTTAFIPTIAKKEKKEEEKGEKEGKEGEEEEKDDKKKKKDEKTSEKKDKKKGDKKDETLFFISEINEEADDLKLEDKKYKPLKQVSFVNSNPFQIWGQKRTRLVRVQYELILNKKKRKEGIELYDLYRKETLDLKNVKFKEKEEDAFQSKKKKAQENYNEIRSHLIATDIKGIYAEYSMPKPPPEEKKGEDKDKKKKKVEKPVFAGDSDEEQMIQSADWGEKDETKNVVPEKVTLHVALMTKQEKRGEPKPVIAEKVYSCVIPIISYPTRKKKDDKKKEAKPQAKPQKKDDEKKDEKTEDKEQQGTQPPRRGQNG